MSKCSHPEVEIRRRRGIGGWQFRRQCLDCGQPVGGVVPLKRVSHPGSVKKWDHALQERHAQRPLGNSKHRTYQAYLRSPEWKRKRRAVLERDGYVCQAPGCGSPDGLEAHHRTYERFGSERLEDLETLCGSCHRALEGTVA